MTNGSESEPWDDEPPGSDGGSSVRATALGAAGIVFVCFAVAFVLLGEIAAAVAALAFLSVLAYGTSL